MDDEARQGALRLAEKEGGPLLREEGGKRIPLLVELPELLSAAEHVVEDKDTEEHLRLLLAPGSSLGGARPKASVIEKDGQLSRSRKPCAAIGATMRCDFLFGDPESRCTNLGYKIPTSPSKKLPQ